ncbi:hypothetical protein niasHT_014967 [Heterodera trifolii]|uniref:Uncharacterized protein n=1 Tax=Heterodera trifolii TaxID=157864 RepID=A0ABD2LFV6_9BILA
MLFSFGGFSTEEAEAIVNAENGTGYTFSFSEFLFGDENASTGEHGTHLLTIAAFHASTAASDRYLLLNRVSNFLQTHSIKIQARRLEAHHSSACSVTLSKTENHLKIQNALFLNFHETCHDHAVPHSLLGLFVHSNVYLKENRNLDEFHSFNAIRKGWGCKLAKIEEIDLNTERICLTMAALRIHRR